MQKSKNREYVEEIQTYKHTFTRYIPLQGTYILTYTHTYTY